MSDTSEPNMEIARTEPATVVNHDVAVVGEIDATGPSRAQRAAMAIACICFLLVVGGFCIGDRLGPRRDVEDLVERVLRTSANIAPGLDPEWLFFSPPPLPRHAVPTAMLENWDKTSQMMFLCDVNEVFLRALWRPGEGIAYAVGPGHPRVFSTFTVPDAGPSPPFRYTPSTTLPDGLTTNAFGFRGPDLTVDKPARTIRIACVGASTTVDSHHFAWSYPELLQHWFTLWAAKQGLSVRFEVINAGRESIRSADIRAIVQYEVLPFEVDYVVYYEGANQCALPDALRHVAVEGSFTAGKPPSDVDTNRPALAARHGVPIQWLHHHSVLANRAMSLAGFGSALPEPSKPPQRIVLPTGLDENAPDPARAGEFLQLGVIMADLDAIHAACNGAKARLVVASFCWMVEDGLRLDLNSGYSLYSNLQGWWPLSYATVRRLTDVQNRVVAAWAAARGVPFLELADQLPRDPRLYIDAVHNTELGSRLRAWLTFAGLVPRVSADLAAGVVPAPDRHPDPQHPFLRPAKRVTAEELDRR